MNVIQFSCKHLLLLAVLICFAGGVYAQKDAAVKSGLSDKPNILWLVVEDMSPIIEPYGDKTIKTPTITQLANEGITFTNAYSPSGVCAPSRAAIATGMYPSSFGANNMRTTSNTAETGLPKYEAMPPVEAKMLSQYLREEGYYTTNNLKEDYQFKAPKAAWDESGPYAHWRNRKPGQPFYAVVNFTTTHESGLFEPYGFRKIESRHYFSDDRKKIAKLPQHHAVKSAEADTAVHVAKDTDFDIPPYLPDTPIVRRDFWKMYNNLAETDKQIAEVLQQLKDDGLYNNTIIMFYADHGGPLPRQKRLIYDSGLKVPLIIRYPNSKKAGTKDQQLVSFVDFAPTLLNLAGIDKPDHMQGRNFLGKQQSAKRKYIHAAADRFDGFTDVIRAVRNDRFKYIRNYRPDQGYYLPVAYREKIPTMQELLRLRDEGKLTNEQALWFRDKKDTEELFDLANDPHELNNIIADPRYKDIVVELRAEMERWLDNINDDPNLSEAALVKQLWRNKKTQPVTQQPQISKHNDMLYLQSETSGAVISYQFTNSQTWQLYQAPISVLKGVSFKAVAHRIGYKQSKEVLYDAGE